jgi:hypothetical protein
LWGKQWPRFGTSAAIAPLRELWANREQRLDRLHAILPSTATTDEQVTLTLQAWDQCERLLPDFRGEFRVDSTDGDATGRGHVTFPAHNGGVEIVLAGLLAAFLGIDLALATAVTLLYRLCSYWFLILVGTVTGALTATSLTDLAVEVRE